MSSGESASSTRSRTSILLNKNRSLAAAVLGLVAVALGYFLGQLHTPDEFVMRYLIAAVAAYAVFTPFGALR